MITQSLIEKLSTWFVLRNEMGFSARIYNSANITINNNTNTILTFNSEVSDTSGLHSTVTNTGRFTIAKAGWYSIGACVTWDIVSGNRRLTEIKLNGTTPLDRAEIGSVADTVASPTQTLQTLYYLNVNDYVEVSVYQNSGGNVNILSFGVFTPAFWINFVSAIQ